MTDAALQGCPFFPALGAGIGISVVCGEIETWEEVGRDIQLHTFHIALITILIDGILLQFTGLIVCHLRELLAEHVEGNSINRNILFHHHVFNQINETCQTNGNGLRTILSIE